MAVQWGFEHDIHGRLVTCQRPIVFTIHCEDITIGYFKARMNIKSGSDWIETDVVCKGYNDSDLELYSFNVAEYCRNYFNIDRGFFGQLYCSESMNAHKYMFHRDFKFEVWPVRINPDGSTSELTEESSVTREFGVFELNTKGNEVTCADPNNQTRIDNFVNGTADGGYYDNTYGEMDYLSSPYHKLMTNMPGFTKAYGTQTPGPYNVINVNDGRFNFFVS